MNQQNIVVVENLSKEYTRVGARAASGNSTTGVMSSMRQRGPREVFKALKNINFTLKQGEILGVIGFNGSGKTTLLKILSGITEPSQGIYAVPESTTGILETGSGFSADLTGLENIFYYASLLGIRKKKIEEKIEEIIEFSGIGDFIYSPVKHYSQGMYLRLAFSIMVHLEADLLLLDEILSVGDITFRQKVFDHLKKLRQNGTSIILVTQAPKEIAFFCDHIMILDKGESVFFGNPSAAINHYNRMAMNAMIQKGRANIPARNGQPGSIASMQNEAVSIKEMMVCAKDKTDNNEILRTDEIVITVSFEWLLDNSRVDLMFDLINGWGIPVLASSSMKMQPLAECKKNRKYRMQCLIPAEFLSEGSYTIDVFILVNKDKVVFQQSTAVRFVVGKANAGGEETGDFFIPTSLQPNFKWETEDLQ